MQGSEHETSDQQMSDADRYRATLISVTALPDADADDLSEVAQRVGVEKLALIGWARTDLGFARLLASKLILTNAVQSITQEDSI